MQYTRSSGNTNRCIKEIHYDFNSPTSLQAKFEPHSFIGWFMRHGNGRWYPIVETCMVNGWFRQNKNVSAKVTLKEQYQ